MQQAFTPDPRICTYPKLERSRGTYTNPTSVLTFQNPPYSRLLNWVHFIVLSAVHTCLWESATTPLLRAKGFHNCFSVLTKCSSNVWTKWCEPQIKARMIRKFLQYRIKQTVGGGQTEKVMAPGRKVEESLHNWPGYQLTSPTLAVEHFPKMLCITS